jgi:hypothetical protein
MLELDHESLFCFHIGDVFFAVSVTLDDLLPVFREKTFPVSMPLRFWLPPWIAHTRSAMGPMPDSLFSAFSHDMSAAPRARSDEVRGSFCLFTVHHSKLHLSLSTSSTGRPTGDVRYCFSNGKVVGSAAGAVLHFFSVEVGTRRRLSRGLKPLHFSRQGKAYSLRGCRQVGKLRFRQVSGGEASLGLPLTSLAGSCPRVVLSRKRERGSHFPTGTPQIDCAYSAIVRSDENHAMLAMLRIAARVHLSGWRHRSSARRCAAQ